MKFYQLAMGQRFEFEGEVYVRTKPMTAVSEANGRQRFIRRSAAVRPLQDAAPAGAREPPAAATAEALPGAAVREAFDVFYASCLISVDDLDDRVEAGKLLALRDTLREARRRFLDTLSL